MQNQGNLLTRDDTFLGVCEGIGEDLRIPSNLLRAAFAIGLFFSPTGSIAAYLALGLLVLASRLAFPKPRTHKPALALADGCEDRKSAQIEVLEEPPLAAAA